jgi:hypothetical protein
MSNIETILIPDIGDFKDVPVIDVLVKPGDVVAADDTVLVLESDKATLDVPSPAAGTVREVMVRIGDKVSRGSASPKHPRHLPPPRQIRKPRRLHHRPPRSPPPLRRPPLQISPRLLARVTELCRTLHPRSAGSRAN